MLDSTYIITYSLKLSMKYNAVLPDAIVNEKTAIRK